MKDSGIYTKKPTNLCVSKKIRNHEGVSVIKLKENKNLNISTNGRWRRWLENVNLGAANLARETNTITITQI